MRFKYRIYSSKPEETPRLLLNFLAFSMRPLFKSFKGGVHFKITFLTHGQQLREIICRTESS